MPLTFARQLSFICHVILVECGKWTMEVNFVGSKQIFKLFFFFQKRGTTDETCFFRLLSSTPRKLFDVVPREECLQHDEWPADRIVVFGHSTQADMQQ